MSSATERELPFDLQSCLCIPFVEKALAAKLAVACHRRSLSQRVATHNQRVIAEQDALAEEVSSACQRHREQVATSSTRLTHHQVLKRVPCHEQCVPEHAQKTRRRAALSPAACLRGQDVKVCTVCAGQVVAAGAARRAAGRDTAAGRNGAAGTGAGRQGGQGAGPWWRPVSLSPTHFTVHCSPVSLSMSLITVALHSQPARLIPVDHLVRFMAHRISVAAWRRAVWRTWLQAQAAEAAQPAGAGGAAGAQHQRGHPAALGGHPHEGGVPLLPRPHRVSSPLRSFSVYLNSRRKVYHSSCTRSAAATNRLDRS